MSGKTTEERFWEKVDKSGKCWNWTGGKDGDGYGNFRIGSKFYKAHRVAYELAHGSIPDGKLCCHRCDNPGCCRVSHLFLGTRQDNNDDMERKGRGNQPSGEKNGNAKLTKEKVSRIRKEYARGNTTLVKLAEKYGVSNPTISRTITGKQWKHVKQEKHAETAKTITAKERRMATLITFLAENPRATGTEMAAAIGSAKATAQNYLAELETAGVVHKNGNGVQILTD